MTKLHGFLTVFWIALWIVAAKFGWLSSVAFVAHLSVAALVLSSASAWQAARAEREADE